MTWYIDSNGVVYTQNRQLIGFFDLNGDVYDVSGIDALGVPVGSPIGFVDTAGDTYNRATIHLGVVDANRSIYKTENVIVSRIEQTGIVYNLAVVQIGSVNTSLHNSVSKPDWRWMPARAAAGVILLLKV